MNDRINQDSINKALMQQLFTGKRRVKIDTFEEVTGVSDLWVICGSGGLMRNHEF